MARPWIVAKTPPKLSALIKELVGNRVISMIAGAALFVLLRFLKDMWSKWRAANSELLWRRHVDLDVVQACILTTEHLQSLGRIEKRTLFVKPVSEVFRNEHILACILEQAQIAADSSDPMLVPRLSREDKWHVLNTCSNHLSSLFAPYHVFFNEARRTESFYKSAWYCFTLTCNQTEASGRWFITPHKPVGKGDVGNLRIRIVMINEEELRDIASGVISPPSFGLFNDRHETRWKVLSQFAELFQKQFEDGSVPANMDSNSPSFSSPSFPSPAFPSLSSGSALPAFEAAEGSSAADLPPVSNSSEYDPEDNSILRLHVPFPTSSAAKLKDGQSLNNLGGDSCDTFNEGYDGVSKDVVLYS